MAFFCFWTFQNIEAETNVSRVMLLKFVKHEYRVVEYLNVFVLQSIFVLYTR